MVHSMRGLSVPAKLLGILIALAAGFATGGCGTHSASENTALGVASVERPTHSRQRPDGAWVATGEALVARDIANESSGDVLDRRWLFQTACDAARCQTFFLRNSAYGIQRAVLISHYGYYTATFGPIAVGCKGLSGLPGRMRAHFKLWWSSDRSELIADERAVYRSEKCEYGASRTRWTATRWARNDLR